MVYVIDCVNLSLTPKRPEINSYKTDVWARVTTIIFYVPYGKGVTNAFTCTVHCVTFVLRWIQCQIPPEKHKSHRVNLGSDILSGTHTSHTRI